MLKQLEIYGFKSFSEKTILNFEDAINGIVGPNGSGKSNIVDAIKWGLGEQSLREIRAKNPTDVIFGGSESKNPLNWCEVSVVFDNSRRIFPIDYEEVAITRKIYRTGETEYFINKVPCRLKDIKELILDTGLSSDGYGIIPQGKVEFVVSAKPEERRLLFEETAGIAKYKVKREEALRKLERVKLDMARVEDILAYLKDQMTSLEQAVKKAKNYQKYKEELQMLECAYIVRQNEEFLSKLNEKEKEYIDLSSQYTSLITEITQNDTAIVNVKIEIDGIEKKFLEEKDKQAEIEKNISITTQKIETSTTNVNRTENNIIKINTEIKDIENKISEYINQIAELEKRREQMLLEIDEFEKQRNLHYQEYEIYRKQIGEGHSVVGEKNKLVTEISYQKTKIKNEINNVTRQIHSISLDLHSVNKEIETNFREKNSTKEALDIILQEISLFEDKKEKLNNKLNDLNNEIIMLEEELKLQKINFEEKNKEFYLLSSKLETLSKELSVYGYNSNQLLKILEENNLLDVCKPVNSVISIPEDNFSLISTYLGNKLFWLIVNTEEDAYKIINLLKVNSLGYATIIIKNRIDEIQSQLKVSENILKMINFDEKYISVVKFIFSDVDLYNETIRNDFILHSGYSEQKVTEDFALLREKITEVSLSLKENTERRTGLTKKLDELTEQRKSTEKEIITTETHLNQLYKSKMEKEGYLSSLEELEKTLNVGILDKQKILSETQNNLDRLNEELKKLEENEHTLRTEIDSLLINISELQSNSVVENYVKINSEYTKLQEQYKSLLEEIRSKNELVEYNRQKLTVLQNDLSQEEKTKENLIATRQNDEQVLHKLIEEKKEIDKIIIETVSTLEEKKNNLYQKEENIKFLNEQKEKLQQNLKSIEIERATILNNIENINKLLEDKYNLKLEEAKQLYSDIKEVELQTIEKLKKRLEAMSSVNLAAPEEYAQLEEKYNHLITQQQDLIKAQQDLKDAISKINQQISDNFKDTFYKVRENFVKLCGILFEGGKADLILTDENNLLDSGIEIFVQPPGKKLQNINLLSGGEKSLVAFALLFAFFMVKPSPVCILDEADAQLDETNVVRFMKLLKDFSNDTKFILITHNTRTMEFMDTLYGITMEELGISKVIAIKLQKVKVTA
ncbi:MAG: AAA family ATPase [Endomicrobia bacterium]|nr:AAA family ATPase [Endomicrobiia bacterium]